MSGHKPGTRLALIRFPPSDTFSPRPNPSERQEVLSGLTVRLYSSEFRTAICAVRLGTTMFMIGAGVA